MAYDCRIERDSISERGHRVTTMVVTMPRIVLAEFNTHRVFSRNSASSRAIPVRTQLQKLAEDPFIPIEFGTIGKQMNAGPPLTGEQHDEAHDIWVNAQISAIESALMLTTSRDYITKAWDEWTNTTNNNYIEFVLSIAGKLERADPEVVNQAMLRVSKGQTNRLLEPFMWHELIVTATEWENFFALRTDENAQQEIRTAADLMKSAYDGSSPSLVREGEWHLPFIQAEEEQWAKENPLLAVKSSMARSARVSYLTHDTKVIDYGKDEGLADRLSGGGHMSPAEHPLYPISKLEWQWRMKQAAIAREAKGILPDHVVEELAEKPEFSLNMRGWVPARRDIANQAVYQKVAA